MERDAFANALKKVRLEGFVWPDPDDAGDLRLIKNVIECGCHITAVDKEAGHPGFAYSIGLYLNYLQPEIIIVEMDRAAAGRAVNRIAAYLKNGGILTCGVPYDGFHDSAPLTFRELRMADHTEELGFGDMVLLFQVAGTDIPSLPSHVARPHGPISVRPPVRSESSPSTGPETKMTPAVQLSLNSRVLGGWLPPLMLVVQ